MIRWRKRSAGLDLEATLRTSRPKPRSEFVDALVEDVRDVRRTRLSTLRVAVAVGVTAMLLVPLTAFGGYSYAVATAHQVAKVVHITKVQKAHQKAKVSQRATRRLTAADQEYRPGKGCGDKNHIHLRENECKKPPK